MWYYLQRCGVNYLIVIMMKVVYGGLIEKEKQSDRDQGDGGLSGKNVGFGGLSKMIFLCVLFLMYVYI